MRRSRPWTRPPPRSTARSTRARRQRRHRACRRIETLDRPAVRGIGAPGERGSQLGRRGMRGRRRQAPAQRGDRFHVSFRQRIFPHFVVFIPIFYNLWYFFPFSACTYVDVSRLRLPLAHLLLIASPSQTRIDGAATNRQTDRRHSPAHRQTAHPKGDNHMAFNPQQYRPGSPGRPHSCRSRAGSAGPASA